MKNVIPIAHLSIESEEKCIFELAIVLTIALKAYYAGVLPTRCCDRIR